MVDRNRSIDTPSPDHIASKKYLSKTIGTLEHFGKRHIWALYRSWFIDFSLGVLPLEWNFYESDPVTFS